MSPSALRQERAHMLEGMRVVHVWLEWGRDGIVELKKNQSHLGCCQEGQSPLAEPGVPLTKTGHCFFFEA